MNRLPSRRPLGRFTPKVETLEDRSLLAVTIVGTSIITTAAVNKILITDDGTTIRVFTDNSPTAPLATFAEGTPLTVKTNKKGSTNSVTFDLLGGNNPRSLNSTLAVNFGKGNGSLTAAVLLTLPTSLDGSGAGRVIALPDLSNVNITATSGGGNTSVSLFLTSIGTASNVQFSDTGTGKGSNTFLADLEFASEKGLTGQKAGSTVGLTFHGGDGPNTATVTDTERMEEGSTTNIDLSGKGTDLFRVSYRGSLAGNLTVNANGGSGNDTITMQFDLLNLSTGSLTASENGGKGNDNLTEVVHKLSTDNPTVTATADGGQDGPLAKSKDRGTFSQTTATAVAVVFSNFLPANVAFVP
jgi:hypothetical protein